MKHPHVRVFVGVEEPMYVYYSVKRLFEWGWLALDVDVTEQVPAEGVGTFGECLKHWHEL
jgi:hypothetical protein